MFSCTNMHSLVEIEPAWNLTQQHFFIQIIHTKRRITTTTVNNWTLLSQYAAHNLNPKWKILVAVPVISNPDIFRKVFICVMHLRIYRDLCHGRKSGCAPRASPWKGEISEITSIKLRRGRGDVPPPMTGHIPSYRCHYRLLPTEFRRFIRVGRSSRGMGNPLSNKMSQHPPIQSQTTTQ